MKPTSIRRTRREFLAAAGAAAAAPYVIPSAVLGTAAPGNRITTALIGSGSRGQQIMAGGDRVVAVCDVDANHRQAAKAKIDAMAGNRSCAAYGDFREVLARDDIDAVVVATPDHWHVPIALAAVKAGKAVYVEKPVSLTIHQGRILADAVRRYGAIVQVGSQQRSPEYEKFTRTCELVRNGYLGKLQTVRVEILTRGGSNNKWAPRRVPPELDYEMWLGPAPYSPYHPDRVHYKFRFVSDFSGGDMTNWGAHHLDIAQWGIGADDSGPVEVEGRGKRNATGIHDTFYDLQVDFRYAGGETVELRSLEGSGSGGVRFQGSEGWIFVGRDGMSAEPASLLTARVGPNDLHLAPPDQPGSHMGIWLDCVRRRSPKGLNVPVEIGHRSATLCHLANIAMEVERKLQWDPAAEQFVGDDEANLMTWRPMRQPWQI
ncbi:MAG: Gfo/Idh/MocA family oxidoreductase [Pirellulales bacterium]|nr:Gfo/Idh/MocA family oxidoreductase [Pirellulales bacterium]